MLGWSISQSSVLETWSAQGIFTNSYNRATYFQTEYPMASGSCAVTYRNTASGSTIAGGTLTFSYSFDGWRGTGSSGQTESYQSANAVGYTYSPPGGPPCVNSGTPFISGDAGNSGDNTSTSSSWTWENFYYGPAYTTATVLEEIYIDTTGNLSFHADEDGFFSRWTFSENEESSIVFFKSITATTLSGWGGDYTLTNVTRTVVTEIEPVSYALGELGILADTVYEAHPGEVICTLSKPWNTYESISLSTATRVTISGRYKTHNVAKPAPTATTTTAGAGCGSFGCIATYNPTSTSSFSRIIFSSVLMSTRSQPGTITVAANTFQLPHGSATAGTSRVETFLSTASFVVCDSYTITWSNLLVWGNNTPQGYSMIVADTTTRAATVQTARVVPGKAVDVYNGVVSYQRLITERTTISMTTTFPAAVSQKTSGTTFGNANDGYYANGQTWNFGKNGFVWPTPLAHTMFAIGTSQSRWASGGFRLGNDKGARIVGPGNSIYFFSYAHDGNGRIGRTVFPGTNNSYTVLSNSITYVIGGSTASGMLSVAGQSYAVADTRELGPIPQETRIAEYFIFPKDAAWPGSGLAISSAQVDIFGALDQADGQTVIDRAELGGYSNITGQGFTTFDGGETVVAAGSTSRFAAVTCAAPPASPSTGGGGGKNSPPVVWSVCGETRLPIVRYGDYDAISRLG